jgi:hypothetical protein
MNDRWMVAKTGVRLRELKTTVFTSFYLFHDPKPVVCLRARLRMDVANNSASRHHRGLESSPRCVRCNAPEDTRDHLLVECRAFADIRTITASKLGRLSPPVTLSSYSLMGVVGDSHRKPSKAQIYQWKQILDITGEMLQVINTRMHRL